MTINQWIDINNWAINPNDTTNGKFWLVDVAFINSRDRSEDDVAFIINAYDLDELNKLYDEFCKESCIVNHTVVYVAVVETANSEEELM